jgi:tetratricopeptide (TPR) repeat protein
MRRPQAALAALLVLLPLAAYFPALSGDFVWDDDYNVTDNVNLRDLAGLRRIWTETRATQQFYPLTHTSFWIDWQLWGANPLGYHVINVLLHAGSALLLWRVLVRLDLPGAWLGAALFALHPVHVESVAWITERKNALSGVLYWAAALCFLRYALPAEKHDTGGRAWLAPLAVVLFAGALLAKTATATLPLALGLVVLWKRGWCARAGLGWLLLMLAGGAGMGWLTLHLETHSVGAQGPEFSLSLAERILVAGRAIWFYLGKLAWPAPLAFSYAKWALDAGVAWQYLYAIGAALALLALGLLRRRIGAGPLVAAAYFGLTLAPALGFFNVFYMRYAFVADHFQYLASAGPLALAAAGAARLRGAPAARGLLAGALLALLGGLTWQQAGCYRDERTLWTCSLAAEPDSFMAHYNLGELLERGGSWDEAVTHYRETLRLQPRWSDAWVNLGSIRGKQGRLPEALSSFDAAIAIEPGHATAHYNRGLALELLGSPDAAEVAYLEAVRLRPDLVQAHNNLALLHFRSGNYRAAWASIHQMRRHGADAGPELLRDLSARMADPGG